MTKQLRVVIATIWIISAFFIIGVYVQHDETSTREALSWWWITVAATVVIIGGTWIKDNLIDRKLKRK